APHFTARGVAKPLLPKRVATEIPFLHRNFFSHSRFSLVGHPINKSVEFAKTLEVANFFPGTHFHIISKPKLGSALESQLECHLRPNRLGEPRNPHRSLFHSEL